MQGYPLCQFHLLEYLKFCSEKLGKKKFTKAIKLKRKEVANDMTVYAEKYLKATFVMIA
jgi:hypothetical protein